MIPIWPLFVGLSKFESSGFTSLHLSLCRQECPQLGNTDSNHRAIYPQKGASIWNKMMPKDMGRGWNLSDVYSLHSACMSSSSILIERENDEIVRVWFFFKIRYNDHNTEVSHSVRLALYRVFNNCGKKG